MIDPTALIAALGAGRLHRFRDWPNREIPAVAAGVYAIWGGSELIYAGMAGRSLTAESVLRHREDVTKVTGLRSRLNSHASGRRSGDQFCLYVGDLLVLPTLSRDVIAEIGARTTKLDDLVRDYVRERFSYRYIEVADGEIARTVESEVRRGALGGIRPRLNPL